MENIVESNTLLNVLCLEDDLKDAELINEMLVDAGYLVSMDIAEGEREYAEFLKGRNYDIILSDNSLPGFDAFSALRLALALKPEIPFICVSGTIGEEKAVELLKHGASDYVLKDRLGRLAFAVSWALEGAQNKKEKQKAEQELIIANKELIFQNEEKEKRTIELLKALEHAEESDHLKTAFLHNISHEIRTPMNAIVGFSALLCEPDLPHEKYKHFTDIIIQSSDHLLSIISDIISIATLEAGQEKISEKEIDLNSTLKSMHEQFLQKVSVKTEYLNLKCLLPESQLSIISDETKLVQVLSNLIGNSLKFTKQGYVNFGYLVKESVLEFFVEDTGIGIPPEMHQEIFNRFRQVDGTAQQFGGSGLGLSISKAYVDLMGGKMWLSSELGKGSTFYFTIPYKRTQNIPLSDNQSVDKIKTEFKTAKTLLIAEDEDSNFLLLEQILSGLNINIIRAVNGIEAVNICKTNQGVDLVLMDIKMPLMNGYEATKQIKSFMPNLPVIAQTAYSTNLDKNRALECGCKDFISKPINRGLLISKIKAQLYIPST
ncbi:MAG: response regulator [Bacteroidales bacterium]|nr:MAG: response regulator [Bacteroidales bacterium]